MEKVVLKLTGENERLKADLRGGRSTAEEQEALETKQAELENRARRIDQREDELTASRVDLSNKMSNFYSTVGDIREEVGQAKQIKIDYEDTKKALGEALMARDEAYRRRDFWKTLVGVFLIIVIIICIPIALYIVRLRYSKETAEKFKEILEVQLENPSINIESVKAYATAYSQLTNSDESPKFLKPGDTSVE